MYNWSVDEKELAKNPEKYTVWKLEQLINFGLNGQKISRKDLKKYFGKIKVDPHRKALLGLFLHGKINSH